MQILRTLWAYRGFILGSVQREFQSKYQRSMLGATWTVLNPLAMIVVYTVIFSQVMRAKLPGVDSTFGYSIYLCAGILTWGLFAEITTRGQNIFIENANLIKKLSFPRLCLPLALLGTALLNFAIVFFLFTGFLLLSGSFPGWVFVGLFPVIAIVVVFAIGLGMILGVLNVFFRDVGQFFGIAITFWFWLTPIVYPLNIVPEIGQKLLGINPLVPLLSSIQGIVVSEVWPQWSTLIYPTAVALGLCVIAWRLFKKRSGEMVDEL